MSSASGGSPRSPLGRARLSRLREARLYLVTDDATPADGLPELVAAAARGGADLVQLRRKGVEPARLRGLAEDCLRRAREGGALFLVDDHVELARQIGADGVHLGQQDQEPARARARLGPDAILGVSTHALPQPRSALESGADYISAGPVFSTPTKPGREAVGFDYVSAAATSVPLPLVAIGGLAADSAGEAIRRGADMIGVVRCICQATDPEAAARELRRAIGHATPWDWLEVNGERRRCPGGSRGADLLRQLGLGLEGVVVELNGEMLTREGLETTRLLAGDRLEVVHLVGGGMGHG